MPRKSMIKELLGEDYCLHTPEGVACDLTFPATLDTDDDQGEVKFLVLKRKDETTPFENIEIIKSVVEKYAGPVMSVIPFGNNAKCLIKTTSAKQYNKLLTLRNLPDGDKIVIEPHRSLNRSQYIINCDELSDMSDEEITDELMDQNHDDLHCEQENGRLFTFQYKVQDVINVRRFIKKVDGKKVPTKTFLITIGSAQVPKNIRVAGTIEPTKTYYPQPSICGKCLRYGHTKGRCTSVIQRCRNCTSEDHENCTSKPICFSCDGDHKTLFKQCPVYQRETEIIKYKIDNRVSAKRARQILKDTENVIADLMKGKQDVQNDIATADEQTQTIIVKMAELMLKNSKVHKNRKPSSTGVKCSTDKQ